MQLDDMNQEQLRKLAVFIGNGVRPIKQFRVLYPDHRVEVQVIRDVRNYCYNKMTALNHGLLWETKRMYVEIAANIWCDLPSWAREIDSRNMRILGIV